MVLSEGGAEGMGMDGTISMDCAIKLIPGKSLEIAYQVSNGTSGAIFLFTPLVDAGEMRRELSDGEKAYTFLDDEGYLHVTKRVWPVPMSVDIYKPEVPRVTGVPAGCFFEERFCLSVPVGIEYPYRWIEELDGQDPESDMAGLEARGILFSVGYVRAAEGEVTEGVGALPYERAVGRQEILVSEGVEAKVGVRSAGAR